MTLLFLILLDICVKFLDIWLLSSEDKCEVIWIKDKWLFWADYYIVKIVAVVAFILILVFKVLASKISWSSLIASELLLRSTWDAITLGDIVTVDLYIRLLLVSSIQSEWDYILLTHRLKKLPELFTLALFRDWYTKQITALHMI